MQGGSISPLLANVYLHYVFDLWAHQWRRRYAHGDVMVVRFADDFVMGFQRRDDAEQCLVGLARTVCAVRVDAASHKNAAPGIRPECRPRPAGTWRGETRELPLSRVHAQLCDHPNRDVHGTSADHADAGAGEAEGRQNGASTTHAPAASRNSGRMCGRWCRGTSGITAVPLNYRSLCAFETGRRDGSGGRRSVVGVNNESHGRVCTGTLPVGFRPCASVTRTRLTASAS